MNWLGLARNYWPRRSDGLPPGQREVRAFPRFSDDPLRPAPALSEPSLTVMVGGAVVAELSAADLEESTRVTRTHDFHCVTTWTYRDVEWSGWPLVDILRAADVDVAKLAPFAKVAGDDRRHAVFMTEDLVQPSVLIADLRDGEPVGQRHGGPLRLVAPEQYGYKNVKHVSLIEFSEERPAGSFGDKEHLRGRVALEERHGGRPNWLLRLPYRLAVVPTALAAEVGLKRSRPS